MAQNKKVICMVECAILIALATVLSLIKFVDLPYGGSITVASMLPIALISYRRGLGWGLGSRIRRYPAAFRTQKPFLCDVLAGGNRDHNA